MSTSRTAICAVLVLAAASQAAPAPTLEGRLARIRKAWSLFAPKPIQETVQKHIERLAASGVATKAPQVGQDIPPFELADASGRTIRSDDLIRQGPLVVAFYRGYW